jgi:hypothetical protein
MVEEIDVNGRNMKLSQIIINEANEPDYTGIDDNIRQRLSNYKSHEQQWALTELKKGESIESIIDGLEYYRDKIKDNRFQQILKPITNPINHKSLTQITLKQIKAGQQQYDAKYGGVSKRGAKRKAKETKHEYMSTLINEPDLKVIKIEKTDDTTGAAEAAREIAKGTDWCVSCIETGERYLKQGPLYYIEYEGDRYLCHMKSEQLMDVYDEEYEIDIELYHRLVKYIKGIEIFIEDKTLPEYRDAIKHDPGRAYLYARDVINGRWPEVESYIKDSKYAYYYAVYVIKGRWPEAEPYIIRDHEWAYLYARDVIKGRWLEAEQYIMQDPENAYDYARYVIKGRWPEAEPYIIRDREWAHMYARDIKGRWPEAEPIIMKDPYYAYHYARDVIEGRWPEAEPIIMKDPYYVYRYSQDVIKGRWLEAEPIIKNSQGWLLYKEHFKIKDQA